MKKFGKSIYLTMYKTIGWVLSVVFVVSMFGVAMRFWTIPFLKFNKQVDMERGIVAKTYNAENALYNYRWFKDMAETIKATEINIENAIQAQAEFRAFAGARSGWTFEDKQQDSYLSSLVIGQKNYYQQIVGEYNSRASQVDRAIFQDELPLFFSLKAY